MNLFARHENGLNKISECNSSVIWPERLSDRPEPADPSLLLSSGIISLISRRLAYLSGAQSRWLTIHNSTCLLQRLSEMEYIRNGRKCFQLFPKFSSVSYSIGKIHPQSEHCILFLIFMLFQTCITSFL